MKTIKFSLQEELIRDADELGLLTPEKLAELLRAEIRRVRTDQLFFAADKMAALDGPAMTPEEVEVEIRSQQAAENAART
jgi:hypothetical protein